MIANFRRGSFNNFYADKAIRKNALTLRLFKEAVKKVLENGWTLSENGIWVTTPQEEKHFEDIDAAISFLSTSNKGGIFISIYKGDKRAFVRWYDSDPQNDVLSIEGELTFKENKVISYTKVDTLTDIVDVFSTVLLAKVSVDDVKDLSEEYEKTMQTDWIREILGRAL